MGRPTVEEEILWYIRIEDEVATCLTSSFRTFLPTCGDAVEDSRGVAVVHAASIQGKASVKETTRL